MATTVAPPPVQNVIIDQDAQGRWTGLMTRQWVAWLNALIGRIQQAAGVLNVVSLTDQSAATSPTAIPVQSISAGLYRLSWALRITQAATTSSSVTVSFGWTDHGVTCTTSGATVTGNSVTTVQSGSVLVHADQTSPLTYSTSYSSSGATAMTYRLFIVTEQLS